MYSKHVTIVGTSHYINSETPKKTLCGRDRMPNARPRQSFLSVIECMECKTLYHKATMEEREANAFPI